MISSCRCKQFSQVPWAQKHWSYSEASTLAPTRGHTLSKQTPDIVMQTPRWCRPWQCLRSICMASDDRGVIYKVNSNWCPFGEILLRLYLGAWECMFYMPWHARMQPFDRMYWDCIYDAEWLCRGGEGSEKIYELKYVEIEWKVWVILNDLYIYIYVSI